jgi:hypothetical protein
VRDRLLRLGVPFVVFVGLLWPLLMYPVHPPGEAPGSYRAEFLRHGSVDTGVFWFIGVLLIFSLAYAGGVWARRGHAGRRWRGEVGVRHLVLLAAAVTVATFLVRLALPYYSDNKGVDVNLYQWPECVALFGLGVAAARRGGWPACRTGCAGTAAPRRWRGSPRSPSSWPSRSSSCNGTRESRRNCPPYWAHPWWSRPDSRSGSADCRTCRPCSASSAPDHPARRFGRRLPHDQHDANDALLHTW